MPLFGKSTKSPAEVVRNLKEALLVLESKGSPVATGEAAGAIGGTAATQGPRDKKQEKAQEDLSKHLQTTKRY